MTNRLTDLFAGVFAFIDVAIVIGVPVTVVAATRRGGLLKTDGLSTSVKYASEVTYWPEGPLNSLTFANGTTLSQTFNLRYGPLTITSGPSSFRDPDPE